MIQFNPQRWSTATRWLVLIIVVSFGLRIWQIGYGLPRLSFTDEPFFTTPALRIANGGLNPGWFGAPAQPQIYITGFVWGIWNSAMNIADHTHLSAAQAFRQNPTPFIVLGRLLSAMMGTVAVGLVYKLGRRYSPAVGLTAAALVGFNFYLIDHSHVIRPDIWQTTFLLIAVSVMIRILEGTKSSRDWFVGAVAFGLAITEKFTSVLLLIGLPVVWVHLWRHGRMIWRRWAVAGLVAFTTIFVTAPFLFITPLRAAHDLALEIIQHHNIHTDLGPWHNLMNYFKALNWELGTGLALLGLGSYLWSTKKGWHAWIDVPFIAALIYIATISLTSQSWDRWMIPVTTLLTVPMAAGLVWFWHLVKPRALVFVVLALVFIAPAVRLGRTVVGFQLSHTAEQAREWVLENVPAGSTLVVEPYGPVLSDRYTVITTSSLGLHPPTYYQQHNEHVLIAAGSRSALARTADRYGADSSYAHVAAGYDNVITQTKVAADFPPYPNPDWNNNQLLYASDWSVLRTLDLKLRRGPHVTIYRLP